MTRSPARSRDALRAARRARIIRRRRVVAVLLVGALLGAGILAAFWWPGEADAETAPSPRGASATVVAGPTPTPTSPPTPTPTSPPTPTPAPSVCDDADVRTALAAGDDLAVIAAIGGGEAFRAAATGSDAACLDLHGAGRLWVVVNKLHPLDPIDHWPTPQEKPRDVRVVAGGGWLRADAAAALDTLAAAVVEAGAGRLGVDSAFRPYAYQVDLYDGYVFSRGREAADLRSARPGHSEHQTGLAVDVVACGSAGCTSHDGFRGTAQALWVADNAWRYGFIVRYEDGQTPVTGYAWEPWHLRYIGVELATAYHQGGYRTLEAFFGLASAPDYAD